MLLTEFLYDDTSTYGIEKELNHSLPRYAVCMQLVYSRESQNNVLMLRVDDGLS